MGSKVREASIPAEEDKPAMLAAAAVIRRRNIAKERIVEQFGDVLRETGIIFVDCDQHMGHAVVIRNGAGFDTHWLDQKQVRTLQGRID